MNTLKRRQQAAHMNTQKVIVTRQSLHKHTEQFAPSGTDSAFYENGRTLPTGVVLTMSTGTGV